MALYAFTIPLMGLDRYNLFTLLLLGQVASCCIRHITLKLVLMAYDWASHCATPVSGCNNYTPESNDVNLYKFLGISDRIRAWRQGFPQR